MTDLVGVLETFSDELTWALSYGNAANNNLLTSDKVAGKIYFLLDPITRVKTSSEFGGGNEWTFSGNFMLVQKSNLDRNYHKQKNPSAQAGKYLTTIEPLLTSLELMESKIQCSNYEITAWSVIDAINALDVNMDGLVVTFTIKIQL